MKRATPLKAIRKCCLDCMRNALTVSEITDEAFWSLDREPPAVGVWDEELRQTVYYPQPMRPLNLPDSAWKKIAPNQRAVRQGVRDCEDEECALWPWRMGKRLTGDEA